MDVRDRVPQPPPPPPKRSTGVSFHTLVLAALSAGAAALLTSTFWPRGSIYSAALTPVIVALVSELLRKPTARVGQVATSIPGRRLGRRRGVGGGGRPALDRPDPTAPSRAPADSDRPYVVYGRARIRPRVVLATAALGFLIAVVAITMSEQIFGGAVANDRQRTFLPGRSSAEDERPEEELAPDAGKTDAETDTTQTQTTTTTTTTTTPEGGPAPTQTDGPQPTTPTTTTPATPPSAPESQAQPPR